MAALKAAVPEMDGTALAEALWLASRMASDDRTGEASEAPLVPPEPPATPEPAPQPAAETASPPAETRAETGTRALHERLAGGASRIRGDAVAVPRAAGLPLSLEVTRALRPWKRPWRQGRRHALDIEATVEGYARSGELIPAFTAAPERWFDLVLIVDRSPAMQVWQETIADFTAVLDRLGAFRTLQVRDLTVDRGLELRDPQGRLTGPGELRAPGGRRLVVVVSDCAAPGWRGPAVWRQLREWSVTTPVALLNPLPTKLWRRTGLDLPTVRVFPRSPGSGNSNLTFDTPPLLPVDRESVGGEWYPIPVLSLSPHSLDRWSRAVMRAAPEGCGAVLVPPSGRTSGRLRRPSRSSGADARVEAFLRTATPAAARLAVLCSAFDRLGMRLLRLIRQELVPEATTADVAELLTSGLFSLGTDAGGTVELDLAEAVQGRLRHELAEHELWRINRAISRHVSSRGDGGGQLPSVAYAPESTAELLAERQAFGQASRRTLELLGLAANEASTLQPAEAGRGVPAQLPAAVPLLVGRERSHRELVRFLTSPGSPVVSVAARGGQAGAGKTTLAVHTAHALAEHFPDGRLFVDLRGASARPLAPSSVLAGFLRALGVPPESIPASGGERSELYRATVAGRRLLILLDNAHDAHQVRPLLPDSDGCAVLITSRNALTRVQTHALQLGPLDDADGVELLRYVAGRAGTLLAPDEALELVRGCDGWPLPIALIAKWIALGDTPPGNRIALRLRGKDPEISALDTVLQLCFSRLEPGLHSDLLLLAQPDAGYLTIQEITALLGTSADAAVGSVEVLVRRGLLEHPDVGRSHFGFHDAVRRFARVQATAQVRSDAMARLLDHYSRAAVSAYAAARPGDRLAQRLGLSASESVGPPGTDMEGLLEQSPNLLFELASEHGHPQDNITRAGVLLLLRDLAGSPQHASQYREATRAVIESATAAYATLSLARARVALAHSHFAAGLLDEAERELADAPYDVLPDHATLGLVEQLRGDLAQQRGAADSAMEHFSRARSIAREESDLFAEASALHSLALLQLEARSVNDAIGTAERALVMCQELGASSMAARLHHLIGKAWHDLGDHQRAAESRENSLRLSQATGSRGRQGLTLPRRAESTRAASSAVQPRDAAREGRDLTDANGPTGRRRPVLGHAIAALSQGGGTPREQFVLLDEQRVAYESVRDAVRQARRADGKEVVVVTGGPGSGKSVIALSLLGDLYRQGIPVLHATGSRAVTTTMRTVAGAHKREVRNLFRYFNGFASAESNGLDVLICDEAHGIRESSVTRFTPASQRTGKRQIDELIDAARVPVFLLDEHQLVRPGEVGTVENIRAAAAAKGLKSRMVSLDGQFRCGSSEAYLRWVARLLGLEGDGPVEWEPDGKMQLAVADSPWELEAYLEGCRAQGYAARMTAGFCWRWTTTIESGDLLPLDVRIGEWARPWNVSGDRRVAGAPPGALWATDPAGFGQVGTVYAAQGFEYDWGGVIIGPDLVWRGEKWVTDRRASKDPVFTRATADAEVDRFIRNRYKVLLTRGMVGTVIYSTDAETRAKLHELAGGAGTPRPAQEAHHR
ncbi:DUF2075 domain-containing protein [Streptomyces decoyicus]|nr:DUF2075 domain-containing protein [Streptomyces decoyicus]